MPSSAFLLLAAPALLAVLPKPPVRQSHSLVNAPVAPEAIYIARNGARAGLSVIDLNGFGQGTGNPAFDPVYSIASEGKSMFPFNPNVSLQGSLLTPPLNLGSSTLDGGSEGIFTLTKDTNLNSLLAPVGGFGELSDMMLGHPLDLIFNNGSPPFGCSMGGGSLCSLSALKLVGPSNTTPSSTQGPVPLQLGSTGTGTPGLGNPISWAPHPNPPPLLSTPLCQVPLIRGQEPTSIESLKAGFTNLLAPGSAFGDPSIGFPPTGLLSKTQTTFFVGPSQPQATVSACQTFQIRQQVGQFLYAIDRAANELVILNSNRMTLLGKLPLTDPTELAIDPNLDFLAVTNQSAGTVTFIDILPGSPTFHQIVNTVTVGNQPTGIAWQPDNEDILVCNTADNSLSIISASTQTVRKTISVGNQGPFALAITPRHTNFSSKSNVYYAWILDSRGSISLFESGPSTPNGWGYDDIVARSDFSLSRAKALQLDPNDPAASVWVIHERAVDLQGNPIGTAQGAATQLLLNNPIFGITQLVPASAPNPRGKTIDVVRSLGSNILSGQPTDLAFDNLSNLGVYPNPPSVFGFGLPAATNGKHPMRAATPPIPTNRAAFMFLPVSDGTPKGQVIDVIDLASGQRIDTNPYQPGVQSIPAPGANLVMDYFRQ